MKNKKLLVLALALVFVFAMTAVAFAADTDTGTITITPPSGVTPSDAEITYQIYKVFDATTNGTAISYTLCENDSLTTAMQEAGFSVDSAGNVSGPTELNDAAIAAIAAYVTGDDLVKTVTTTAGTNAVAEGLSYGYYYITTSTGTVVTIDSTNTDAEVIDKNTVPSVEKVVGDPAEMDAAGQAAIAQVGTVVEYKATITVGKGQVGYVFKDTLGTGLEYVADSLSVEGVAEDGYTVEVSGQNITVKFKDEAIKDLKEGAKIVVSYQAKVTSDALSTDPAKNTATISYGNDSQYTSEPAQADVYNAKITVTKKDGDGNALAGAGFVLKNSDDQYYKLENGVVSWVASIDDATEYTSDENGAVTAFTGLGVGEYTLVEKTVPAGYNKAADQSFEIKDKDYTVANLEQTATVTNNAGAELPSTGGIGTTIFMVLGGILMAAAVVLFITKKRVGAEK